MNIIGKIENIWSKIDTFAAKPFILKGLFLFTVIVSFLLIYLLNYLHPLFGDDWMYSVSKTGRITSFSEILQEQYKHYFEWGGRTVVHIIAQSLLLAGTATGDLLNSIAYLLFVFVIYYIANRGKKTNIALFIGINMAVWFFTRDFASTLLWITGSANYLWGTLIVLVFLIPYIRFFFDEKKKKDNMPLIIFFFIGGIIAGWTNENTSIGLIFLLISFFIYYKKTIGIVPKWSISGCLGAVTGCIIMLIAPGNQVRSAYLEEYENKTAAIYSLESLANGLVKSFFGFYENTLPLVYIFFIAVILFFTFGDKTVKNKVYTLAALLLTASVIATLAMAGSPVYPARASFGLNSFIILAIAVMYCNMDIKNQTVKWLGRVTVIFALSLFSMSYYSTYKELKYSHTLITERINTVEGEKNKGNKNIVLKGRCNHNPSRFLHFWELTDEPTDAANYWFSRYYEIETVKMICDN